MNEILVGIHEIIFQMISVMQKLSENMIDFAVRVKLEDWGKHPNETVENFFKRHERKIRNLERYQRRYARGKK